MEEFDFGEQIPFFMTVGGLRELLKTIPIVRQSLYAVHQDYSIRTTSNRVSCWKQWIAVEMKLCLTFTQPPLRGRNTWTSNAPPRYVNVSEIYLLPRLICILISR